MISEVDGRLSEHRRIWNEKPTLRAVYADFHRRLEAACPPGPLLDIGGGSAHFKSYRPDVVSLDILPFSGIDVVADAHAMPLPDAAFAGIVMLDVLHHLRYPMAFMREAARVLRPAGRLAMIEPGMSHLSTPFYRLFHQEPVIMSADPFAEGVMQSSNDPWDSNQAIPTLMFGTQAARDRLGREVPALKVASVEWLSLFAYPLSGGFKSWSLLPTNLVNHLIAAEDHLMPYLGPLFAFRLFIIVEKTRSEREPSGFLSGGGVTPVAS
jgi:SAM-dependent methyltransferase